VSAAEDRLRALPWGALAGLAPALDAPLAELLGAPHARAEGGAGPGVDRSSAERVLDRLLRARRDLGREGRAAVAEAIFGVGLWRRRLAFQLGDDAAEPARHAPRLLLAALVRDLGGRPAADVEALLGLAPGALPPARPPPPDLARRWSLPAWLAAELERAAGDAAPALAEALALPGPVTLRVNGARTTREALAARLAAEGIPTRPGRLAAAALVATGPRPNLLAAPAFREGLLEVQDEGSQLAGGLVAARPGEDVLDLCAGAGGKSLLLAAAGARVHACDADPARLSRLAARAARAGAAIAVHGASPPLGARFDAALVDAPCSGLGPLRRGPDQRFRLDPACFAALPALQLALLARAAGTLRRGGRLVYVTCTFRREENEEVARAFEGAHPSFRRERPAAPAPLVGGDGFFRALPHLHGTDGFFGAVWRAPTCCDNEPHRR
jgi:16S rRNA (cytosine967-C5)-methyltransferase